MIYKVLNSRTIGIIVMQLRLRRRRVPAEQSDSIERTLAVTYLIMIRR